MTPYQDMTPYRNFHCVLKTCGNCIYASRSFGVLNICNKTINWPKENYVCDEWSEKK